MRKLEPYHAGEQGPPYRVNTHVVTRAYSPNRGHYWKVYSGAGWIVREPALFETRTKLHAVAWAKGKHYETGTPRDCVLAAS